MTCGYTKSNKHVAIYCRELAPGTVSLTGDRAQGDDSKHCAYSTRLQGLQQTLSLLWQMNNRKHIDSISKLVRCHTIIVVTFNFMHIQIFRQ